jgi:hypothetical protein
VVAILPVSDILSYATPMVVRMFAVTRSEYIQRDISDLPRVILVWYERRLPVVVR